ncbi:MAG TPA: hypothetical protein EYQ14_22040 [Gammaproteobacteria bacterium]|nr:hypothetical protein [Gammaproteobacteria bacterium]HIL95000.1 hypothetical protein [Pseudomonadales bacterium]
MGNPHQVSAGLDAASAEAASNAITVTVFHWGLHGWGLYVLAGLAISMSAYRDGQPLTFSSALTPLLGNRRFSKPAYSIIDFLALFGTIFGVATSLGLAVSAMNAALEPLLGIEFSLFNQIAILTVVCVLGIGSVLSGVSNGIRRLSEMNIWISLGLLLVIFVLGPTAYLASLLPVNLLDYMVNVIPMGLWAGSSTADDDWLSAWTIFYWGWWLAWTPFVSVFIARISRGRTIREFILAVLFVPVLLTVVWMTVFGGIGIFQELEQTGSVSVA